MNKKIIISILLILALAGYFGYTKFLKKEEPARYILAQVQKGTILVSVSGSGNVISDEVAEIKPDISGEVSELKVALGDKVKKGQLLLVIKSDTLEAKKNQAWITYKQVKDNLEKAKLDKLQVEKNLEDLLSLKEENPEKVSDLDIEIAKQKVNSAKLAIESAENKVWLTWLDYQNAKEEAEKRNVLSPIDGIVTALNVEEGDSLSTTQGLETPETQSTNSSAGAITITNLEKLVANITLNEIDASQVKVGQKATLTFDALPDLTLTGKVLEVDTTGTVSQGVVSYGVKIALDTVSEKIKPGMSVTAEIVVEAKPDVLILPNSAIKTEALPSFAPQNLGGQGNSHYVELIEVPEEVKKQLRIGSSIILPKDVQIKNQPVEIGISNDTSTEIISGLKEGDIVVSSKITQTTTQTTQTQRTPEFQMPGMGGSPKGPKVEYYQEGPMR